MTSTGKLTWTSADGTHQLEAWVEIGIGGVVWCATLDGADEGKLYTPTTHDIPAEARALGFTARIGRVGLTQERHEILRAEAARLAVEYSMRPAALREKREDLCNEIRWATEDAREARDKAFEVDCINGLPGYNTPAVQAARKALADFDAAHPEIVDAIEAEREERRKRHEWD